jgi:hypothetical protein
MIPARVKLVCKFIKFVFRSLLSKLNLKKFNSVLEGKDGENSVLGPSIKMSLQNLFPGDFYG